MDQSIYVEEAPPHNGHDRNLDRRSIPELVKDLAEETATLARQEIELAKAELTEKAKAAGVGAGMLFGAAVIALLALGALTVCFIAALSTALPVWLSALIVTIVYLAIAAVLALVGKQRVQESMPPAPTETVENVKEDVRWAKAQAKSART